MGLASDNVGFKSSFQYTKSLSLALASDLLPCWLLSEAWLSPPDREEVSPSSRFIYSQLNNQGISFFQLLFLNPGNSDWPHLDLVLTSVMVTYRRGHGSWVIVCL